MQSEKEMRRFFLRNRILLGAVWVVLLLLWLFTGSGVFLSICLAVPVLSAGTAALQLLARRKLCVQVHLPDGTAQKKQCIEGSLCAHNGSFVPVLRCFFVVECRNAYTHEKKILVRSASLAPHETVQIPLQTAAQHCGYLVLNVRQVKLAEIFGVAAVTKKETGSAAGMPVFPDIYPVKLALKPYAVGGSAQGETTLAEKGDDMSQTFQLRAYEPGDSLRQIHWKLSEKYGTLITREGSAQERDTLLVYWDPSGSVQEPALADAVAQAVASVCCALQDSGVRFRFCADPTDADTLREEATAEDIHFRILEAIRRDAPASPLPQTVGRGRVLYFSMHQPEPNDQAVCIHCDASAGELQILPDHPLQELEL